MVVYTVEAVTALFASIENMGGRPTFRKLWGFAQEMERALKRVQTRAQPVEGHAPRMRSPAEQALVCNIPWVPPENVGEFFVCPITAITETDQKTAEREWKAKSDRHQTDENVELASILLFERVIPVIYHLGGTAMGIGGFGTQTAYQIKEALRSRFGTPTDAEMKEALVKMETPMIRDEPIEVVLRMMEEVQLFLLAHPEGGHEMTEVQLIRNVIMKMRDLGGVWTRPLEKWLVEPVLTRQTWTYFKTFMVTKYEEMLTARGGSTTLGDDGYAAYNAYGVEDTELTENVVRYAEQATATAAAVGDLTARIAAMEMAAAQPVGLGLPPAPPQAAYYAPQDHYEIPPPQGNHTIPNIPTQDLSVRIKSGLIGACRQVGSRATKMETSERDMAQAQLAHHTLKRQGVPTMDGPAANTEDEEQDEQAKEAEVATSVSISTEAAEQDVKPQVVGVVTPTRTHSRDTTNYCTAPTKDAGTMSIMRGEIVPTQRHGMLHARWRTL